jgi:hypothetical protein
MTNLISIDSHRIFFLDIQFLFPYGNPQFKGSLYRCDQFDYVQQRIGNNPLTTILADPRAGERGGNDSTQISNVLYYITVSLSSLTGLGSIFALG